MTTSEWITAIFSSLAFIISVITAYLTLLKSFSAKVFPGRRPILTQVDNVPCIALECECVNTGARAGMIEGAMVKIYHEGTGAEFKLAAILTRSEFNLFEQYKSTDFKVFNTIVLGPKERRTIIIVFKPVNKVFQSEPGTYSVKVYYHYSYDKHWRKAPDSYHITLSKDVSENWSNPTSGRSVQLEANELAKIRADFLEKS